MYFARIKEQFLETRLSPNLRSGSSLYDPGSAEVCVSDKVRYLYFFEEVALLLKARLIHDKVACYMFGYYALLCDRSRSFWSSSFPKDEAYWLLFLISSIG